MAEVGGPILLGGYAAKQCPVRVQNDFLPLVSTLKWEPSPEDQARLDAGITFEAKVFNDLVAIHPGAAVVDARLRKTDAIARTVHAMDTGTSLILGGWLPDDLEGGRTGKPDILIKVDGGYLPADVKNHLTVKPSKVKDSLVSSLNSPGQPREIPGWSATGHYYEDGLQLAHYTRLLQASGHHPGPNRLWAAVLGTSRIELAPGQAAELVFIWHDLNEPVRVTFSRSRGKARRTLLERYDHEHDFRVKVARTARRIVGASDDPQPLVDPIGQGECHRCPYEQWCAEQMGPDDPSTAISVGGLSTREWLTLRQMGVGTTTALSTVDTEDPLFLDDYAAEVSHLTREQARKRLIGAVIRAQMICDGIEIARTGEGPAEVPAADVEIDVDVEWGIDDRVYMWGARVRIGGDESTARYVTNFVDWEPLEAARERELAARFAAWLRAQRDTAGAAGHRLTVFHWSHPERSRLISILGLAEVADLVDPETGVFLDLEKAFKENFLSLHGSSIKKVAPIFGFAWRVDDPGGAISQTYLSAVHAGADSDEVAAAKEWLLSYNEDDNAAMAAIRDGMRAWTPRDGA
ncbi:recombinase RecB [Mycolicibacterium cyprinidarum]|uniref:Recombinase RecB n=1 Tax=Mycolicibacterium cyprinidarum TaxID=2860311 RepID=A0ABQ4V3R1_9MYCO|nr:recombinase RecB [Mycolicibacterium sp. NGTWSNA01]GJF12591.1 recombinase RecB [Mycolicibacterium sp. NGTWS1803]GJF12806.1 recombinase RecB [Mycolicibacterium sp. NGTWS0302]